MSEEHLLRQILDGKTVDNAHDYELDALLLKWYNHLTKRVELYIKLTDSLSKQMETITEELTKLKEQLQRYDRKSNSRTDLG